MKAQAPTPPADSPPARVFGVSEIVGLARNLVEDNFGYLWIEGEVSNLRVPASGHTYFTLKDARAQLNAALFRSRRKQQLKLQNGVTIRAYGLLSVYAGRGEIQLIVERIQPVGKGSLQEAFERLKKKLAAEGLFDSARKKPLPLLPRRIGIVTSPQGAALRDILNVLTRRFPDRHILIAPARVQGDEAPPEIIAGIRLLNEYKVDVIIVARGGGSLEDLWCFNDESLARTVAASSVPIISAVGHEIDFTICDFAADLRAPTPSAAAELVIGRKQDFENRLDVLRRRLLRGLDGRRLELRNRFTAAAASYVFREPRNILARHSQHIESLLTAMKHTLQTSHRQYQQNVDELALRLRHAAGDYTRASADRLRNLGLQVRALSPLAVLERGFSITRGPDGKIITSPAGILPGQTIETRLARGSIVSTVKRTLSGPQSSGGK